MTQPSSDATSVIQRAIERGDGVSSQVGGNVGGDNIVGHHITRTTINNTYVTPPRSLEILAPPATRYALFGRERELDRALTALREHQNVLIHGMSGIGKSALAAHVAQRLYSDRVFEHGALWINDIGMASLSDVCDLVASQLGDDRIMSLPSSAKCDAIRGLLGPARLLLVLDDVQDTKVAQAFAERCIPAGTALLMTSRRRHPGYSLTIGLDPLDTDAAMSLFRDRASEVFVDDHRVGEICELLGNYPLALVIAAARAETPSANRLYDRLIDADTRLRALVDPADPTLSVRTAFDLSYSDLTQSQRFVFTRLAAFFDDPTGLHLLAEVCGMSLEECEDVVDQLVALSLVERHESRIALRGARYGLHDLVRQYGQEVLGADLRAVQDRVFEAAATFVATLAHDEVGRADLGKEIDLLLGALDYGMGREFWVITAMLGLDLGESLSEVITPSHLVNIGRITLKAAHEADDQHLLARATFLLADALSEIAESTEGAGQTSTFTGEEATELYRAGIELASSHELPELAERGMVCLWNLVWKGHAVGDHMQIFEAMVGAAARLNNPLWIAHGVYGQARIAQESGQYGHAFTLYQEALMATERATAVGQDSSDLSEWIRRDLERVQRAMEAQRAQAAAQQAQDAARTRGTALGAVRQEQQEETKQEKKRYMSSSQ